VVPESYDVGAFPDNFWLLLAEHTWWVLHNEQNVNIGSIKHAFGTDRRVDRKTKMSNYNSSRFHDRQGEFIAEIHEALDKQATPTQEPSFAYWKFTRSEVKCRHTPCEEHPPEPVRADDPLKLDAESNVESPTHHLSRHHVSGDEFALPGPDLLAVSEVKVEVESEIHDDDVAFPGPDPVAVSEVKVEEGSDTTVIKVEPPLTNWVYQEIRRAHSEERMSPGEYPPPAHDPDVKLSDKYCDPFVKHVRFADSLMNTEGSQNNNRTNPCQRCHHPGHQARTYVGQPFHLRLDAQSSEGPHKGRSDWPQDRKLVDDTRAHDNNDNIVERSDTKLDETGAQVWRSILPQGYVYDEKIEVQRDNADDSWYDDSSEASSD
jgi:hypothetical protein